jgi:hypothetical protein
MKRLVMIAQTMKLGGLSFNSRYGYVTFFFTTSTPRMAVGSTQPVSGHRRFLPRDNGSRSVKLITYICTLLADRRLFMISGVHNFTNSSLQSSAQRYVIQCVYIV